uniref:Fat body lipocalin n=3 Tax=Glossina TaxID=44049 RepID=Q2PZ02_GLOMM|nr:lipocalin/milk gland protein [Glossina morsitans morsitans]CAY49913.1 milk gland protein [Glossina morsitans]
MLGRLSALLLVVCVSSAWGIPFLRECTNVKVVENFNLDKFMGTWYVYSGYPAVHNAEQKCQTEVYEKKGENIVEMKSSSYYTKTGSFDTYKTSARYAAPAKFAMTFNQEYPNQPNYFVLGTDYEHYAVIYNCMEFDKPAHTEMLWILTRERVPQAEYVHAAEEIVKEHHFPTNALFPIDQRNCLANQYKTL